MSDSPRRLAFTVCTVTYNRAHLLPRVFESLKAQSLRDFEWLVVDDGSNDDTRSLVQSWIPIAPFPVRYVWKPNGGQYSAMNVGVREAGGYFFGSLDSDDQYVPKALERFLYHWETIPSHLREQFVGVCGLDAYESGEVVGTPFPSDVLDSDNIDLVIKHRTTGDKISVMRTEVMRKFPFPEEYGKYLSPAIVWNRIAREYQVDGLNARSRLHQVRNPKGMAVGLQELITCGRRLPLDLAIRTFANYIRYSSHDGVPVAEQARKVGKSPLFYLCLPLGAALRHRDLALVRRESGRPESV